MTKLYSISGRINAGALEAMLNDRSNGTAAKAPDGSFGAQKYSPTITLGSSVPQICNDCFAHLGGQRQLAALPTLSANPQLSRFPIDVLKLAAPARKPKRASRSKMA